MSSTAAYASKIQNHTRPANWKALAPFGGAPAAATYAAQRALPRLPVPPLQDTLARLRESLVPLARDAAELRDATRKIEALADGLGPTLQRRLEARASEREHWLEEWWDDGAYMGYRDSVVVNVSYFYGFAPPPSHLPTAAAPRAAGLTRAFLLFRRALLRGEIAPEATRDGPVCMDTYRWMFDACRVPGQGGLDWAVSYAEGNVDSPHVAVLHRGHVWRIDAARDGQLLSTSELETQINHILTHTPAEAAAPIGLLTSQNRDAWAADYAALAGAPGARNGAALRALHSAAFVLCLDTERGGDAAAFSRALWHGALAPGGGGALGLGLRNRWCDKPVQLVVLADGQAGIMGEHSVMDGTPTARMCDDALDAYHGADFDHGARASADVRLPARLEWDVPPAVGEASVARAADAARALLRGQELGYRNTPYGKRAIKAFGASPDAWAQMVVQLAYARLLRAEGKVRPGGTYEAASTRKFVKGRTEAIRVLSEASDAFVHAMDDAGASDAERRRRFSDAAKVHIARAKLAGNGLGVDRHLLGLRALVQDGEAVPELYADALVARAKHWALSTSAVFSKHFVAYGWGEVVPDGFGVAYMTGFDDRMQFTVTSRTEMPNARFCDEIERAAGELYALFSADSPTAAAKAKL